MKKYDLWKERVADYRTSNLNAGEWCEKNNLSRATLRYWVTKFNKEKINEDAQQQTNNFVKFTIQDLADNPKETITINFNKLSINVSNGFDPAMLREVFDAISELLPVLKLFLRSVTRNCNLIKVLQWDGSGMCLFIKRLDKGKFQWPMNASASSYRVIAFSLIFYPY